MDQIFISGTDQYHLLDHYLSCSFDFRYATVICDPVPEMINDNFGHAVGDSLIQTMSEKLLAVSNERCRTYRVGGDEFLLILDDPAPGETDQIIHQIKTELSSGTGTTGLRILAAVGSAEGCGADIRSLIKKADAAMYSDKAKSKEGRS